MLADSSFFEKVSFKIVMGICFFVFHLAKLMRTVYANKRHVTFFQNPHFLSAGSLQEII